MVNGGCGGSEEDWSEPYLAIGGDDTDTDIVGVSLDGYGRNINRDNSSPIPTHGS